MNNIGIHSCDKTNFPNLALMKIASYHKTRGANVNWYEPLFNHANIVYSSKIFDFSNDDLYLPPETMKGGTGYDLTIKLPDKIENSQPDYSIYPFCDYSIQLFSRGCIRKCEFCIVPIKEGKIKPVSPLNLNPNGNHIEILDNNFFASPNWYNSMEYLIKKNQPVNFHGVDVRIMTEEHAYFLNKLNHIKQIKIAWDNPNDNLLKKLVQILSWIKPHKLMCYVLVGFDSTEEQDLYRIYKLLDLKIDPFVMPYDKSDPYQRRIARWVNHKAILKSVAWKDYSG